MQRLLVLSAIAVLTLSSVVAPASAGVGTAAGTVLAMDPDTRTWPLDNDGNRIADALDDLAREHASGKVWLHAHFGREPTAADARALEARGATRTYVFNNFPMVKVETDISLLGQLLSVPGVIGLEQFVPPVSHNFVAGQTSRVYEGPAGAGQDDHTKSVQDDLGYHGEGMVIAVLDTGVDNTHEMLDDLDDDSATTDPKLVQKVDPATGQPVFAGADASNGFVVVDCVDPVDDHFHGTHVAGTALGTAGTLNAVPNPGAAPQARLVDVDIAVSVGPGLLGDPTGITPVGSAIGLGEDIALDWIITYNAGESCYGDPGEDRIDVATMSFGSGGESPSTSQAIAMVEVARSGITMFLSAGNGGEDGSHTLGGSSDGAILVAASDDKGTPSRTGDTLATFSSRGPRLTDNDGYDFDELRPDITAPGVNINSALLHTLYVTAGASGTSMSTPHTAGIGALVLQANPTLRPVSQANMGAEGAIPVRDILQKTAEYRSSESPEESVAAAKFGLPWNNAWGYGLADAYAAVRLAESLLDQPLSVSTDDVSAFAGETVSLSASHVGGDGTAITWSWTLDDAPAGSTAALEDADTSSPDLALDVPGLYTVTATATQGSTSAQATASILAVAPIEAATTLYLRSDPDAVTYIGTVDQQLATQPLTTDVPPNEGASFAVDPSNGWNSGLLSGLPGSPVPAGPNTAFELVWQTADSHTILNQEIRATIWLETYSAFNHADQCGPSVQMALWVNDGAWRQIATADVDVPAATLQAQTEIIASLGVVEQATGPLAFTINLPYFDCNGPNQILYDDVDFASRVELLPPASENEAPTSSAGPDQAVDEGDQVTLNGTGSDDDDGTITAYAWAQVAGPTVTLSGASTATASFTAPDVDADTTLRFNLKVTDDGGAQDNDTVEVTVRDETGPIGPQITILDPQDGAILTDLAGGLDVSGSFDPEAELAQQQGGLDLPISWDDPSDDGTGDYVFIDSPSGGTVDGATGFAGRAGNSPTNPNDLDGDGVPNGEDDCPTQAGPASNNGCPESDGFDFGEPEASDLRPGDLSEVCTLNFVYKYQARYFFGSAAHCAATGSNTDTNGCLTTPQAIGSEQQLLGGSSVSETITATLAYSSWRTMQDNDESDANLCYGNDFALFEVAPSDLGKIHPAVRMYGGPTALATDIGAYQEGDEIRGYGRSLLHDDTILLDPEESLANPKSGVFLGQENGGWSYWVYLLPQGVPGDSGGGIMDITGQALGAASTISAAGASNNYANIARALEYMEDKLGWAPELVTWDQFDPEPRVAAYGPSGEPAGSQRGSSAAQAVPPRLDVAIVGGAAGEVGAPVLSNNATHLTVRLPLDGQVDGEVPSSSGTPLSYEVSFGAKINGNIAQTYRVSYEFSSYDWRTLVLEQDADPNKAMTDAFGFAVDTAPDATSGLSYICPVPVDISASHVDSDAGEVVWVIPLAGFAQNNKPVGATCQNFAYTGRSLQGGDKVTGITASAILTTANVNHGDAYGAFTASSAPDYTLDDTNAYVTFTVNGDDAGQAPLEEDGTWTHSIDFAGFTADDGLFTVVASFGTASDTLVYSSTDADPCASGFASKVVVTLGLNIICTDYSPLSASSWSVSFGDLSELPEGANTLRATAYSAAGTALANDTVTVVVPGAGSEPVLAAIGDKTVIEGQRLNFTVSATGAPTLGMTSNLPSGLFTAATGVFDWTPTFTQSGTYWANFTASNDDGSDWENVTITVVNVNAAPVLANPGNPTRNEGEEFYIDLNATDADGDEITYSMTGAHANATLNDTTGVFRWTPALGETGVTNVTFNATDGQATHSRQVRLTVLSLNGGTGGTGGNVAPEIIDLYLASPTALQGSPISVPYVAIVRDNNTDADVASASARVLNATGVPTDLVEPSVDLGTTDDAELTYSGTIELPADTPLGIYTLELTVRDAAGANVTATRQLEVRERAALWLTFESEGGIDFGQFNPGATNVTSTAFFVRNSAPTQHVLFDMTNLTSGNSKIPIPDNARLLLDSDADGDYDDATVEMDGILVDLGEVANGATVGVKVQIKQIPNPLPNGTFRGSFGVTASGA